MRQHIDNQRRPDGSCPVNPRFAQIYADHHGQPVAASVRAPEPQAGHALQLFLNHTIDTVPNPEAIPT